MPFYRLNRLFVSLFSLLLLWLVDSKIKLQTKTENNKKHCFYNQLFNCGSMEFFSLLLHTVDNKITDNKEVQDGRDELF